LPNPADARSNSESVYDFNFDSDIDSSLINMDGNRDGPELDCVRPAVDAQDSAESVYDFNFDFGIDSSLIDMDINLDEPERVRPAVNAQYNAESIHDVNFDFGIDINMDSNRDEPERVRPAVDAVDAQDNGDGNHYENRDETMSTGNPIMRNPQGAFLP
jgi:hypothetical protein